ncbi:DUF4190 domain-containing protein [Micromonospora sp. NPDC050417]|uniref:DUF4190 domain-containing protein n=1 Tax=Micromonospora sp. NPDC050417 TaxID=3364280 RepID=UPI00378DF887
MSDPQQPGGWNAPPGSGPQPESPQTPAPQPPAGTSEPTAYVHPPAYPDPTAYQNPAVYQNPTAYQAPTAYQDPANPGAVAYQYPAGTPDPNAYQYPTGATDPAAQQYQPGYPAPGYPVPGYPPGYGYPAQQQQQNGLAVASLVVSIVGVLGLCGYGLGGYLGIVGAILGHVAKRQIRERGESGGGLATAGIITGWIAAGIAVLATAAIIIFFAVLANNPDAFDSSYTY